MNYSELNDKSEFLIALFQCKAIRNHRAIVGLTLFKLNKKKKQKIIVAKILQLFLLEMHKHSERRVKKENFNVFHAILSNVYHGNGKLKKKIISFTKFTKQIFTKTPSV